MAYDPSKPVDDSLATAVELRNQFNALKALIDAQQATIDAQQTLLASHSSEIADLQDALNALQPQP